MKWPGRATWQRLHAAGASEPMRRFVPVLTLFASLCFAIYAFYVVGAEWIISRTVVPDVRRRLGGNFTIADIEVGFGRATLAGVRWQGNVSNGTLRGYIERVDIQLPTFRLLWGEIAPGDVVAHRPSITWELASLSKLRAPRAGDTRGELHTEATSQPRLPTSIALKYASLEVTYQGRALARLSGDVGWRPNVITVSGIVGATEIHENRGLAMQIERLHGTLLKESDHYVIDAQGTFAAKRSEQWQLRGSISQKEGSLRWTTDQGSEANVTWDETTATVTGTASLAGLHVAHPALADVPLADITIAGDIDASFDRRTRVVTLAKAQLVKDGVSVIATGEYRPTRTNNLGDWRLDISVPRVPCQRAFDALPHASIPALHGYAFDGELGADIAIVASADEPDKASITGGIDATMCRVVRAPARSPELLTSSFTHEAQGPTGPIVIALARSNRDYAPLESISPFVAQAIKATEDPDFDTHHGVAPGSFQLALAENLRAGRFARGGSSITMQLAKNIFLSRRKTLARKIEELVLAWHMEQVLSKSRIMELYLNVVEFGPGLFGVRAAARRFFGLGVDELGPVEAAYLATVLPAPSRAYPQFCRNALSDDGKARVRRALSFLLHRGALSSEDYELLRDLPLEFDAPSDEARCPKPKEVKHATGPSAPAPTAAIQ